MSDKNYEWHPQIVNFVERTCGPNDQWDWSDPDSIDHQFQAIMKVSGMYIIKELNEMFLDRTKQAYS